MDEDLTRRFAELRARDFSRTPSFDAVLAARAPRIRYSPLRLAAAIAVLVAAGAVTTVVYRRATFQPVALASWQSPTASLLAMPGAELISTVPSVTSSIVHIEKGDTI